jgi:hypothetical protein
MGNDTLYVVLVLGAMGFTLITLVLYTLAHQLRVSIERHDLIRDARLQQQAYLRSIEERRRGVNADYGPGEDPGGFNVDIVEDDPTAPVAEAAPARMAA